MRIRDGTAGQRRAVSREQGGQRRRVYDGESTVPTWTRATDQVQHPSAGTARRGPPGRRGTQTQMRGLLYGVTAPVIAAARRVSSSSIRAATPLAIAISSARM